MDFVICDQEISALCGLPHLQQLAYLRGIRPYMDIKTGIVGVKRGISYQSLSEALYVEPHQGIESGSPSKAQLRRALKGLEKAGLIEVQSIDKQLILKCILLNQPNFVQNKAVTNPSQQAVSFESAETLENKGLEGNKAHKPDTPKTGKAVTPLINNNYYLFLYTQFEKFWELYPAKHGWQKAFDVFQALAPSENLILEIFNALKDQIAFIKHQKASGIWVPAWKHPANWLSQHCWKDEPNTDITQENNHANIQANYTKKGLSDAIWDACKSGLEPEETDNVIEFSAYRKNPKAG